MIDPRKDIVSYQDMRRSPCIGCKDRKPDYSCLQWCKKPAEYAASLGDMHSSVPVHMTHVGRTTQFTATQMPSIGKIQSSPSDQMNGFREKQIRRCSFYGCRQNTSRIFCYYHTHHGLRRLQGGWILPYLFAPSNSVLAMLIKQERAGLLDNLDWYKYAVQFAQTHPVLTKENILDVYNESSFNPNGG